MGKNSQIILVNLGNEVYGIPVTHVNEIAEATQIYKLPETPDYIRGMANIRGSIHVIYDLRLKFGLEGRPSDGQEKILLVSSKKAGFLVDDVAEIVNAEGEDIGETSDLLLNFDNRYISSVIKYNDRIIVVFSIDEILRMP